MPPTAPGSRMSPHGGTAWNELRERVTRPDGSVRTSPSLMTAQSLYQQNYPLWSDKYRKDHLKLVNFSDSKFSKAEKRRTQQEENSSLSSNKKDSLLRNRTPTSIIDASMDVLRLTMGRHRPPSRLVDSRPPSSCSSGSSSCAGKLKSKSSS